MTRFGLLRRLAVTWISVSWFAFFLLDVLGDPRPIRIRILRAIVAGFFIALSTAPAYYWRFKENPKSPAA
jgi:hypothetical protein